MVRDGVCRSVTSKFNYFLPRDTKGQEKKLCVRLPGIPDWRLNNKQTHLFELHQVRRIRSHFLILNSNG